MPSAHADFRVEEVLTPAWLHSVHPDPAPFAFYRVTKTGLSTPEAVSRVAAALNVRASAVRAAGLKDKHAKTTQHLTAQLGPQARAKLWGKGWQAERLGWCDAAISAAAIDVNRFTIRVRGLSAERSAALQNAVRRLSLPEPAIRVTNYFGPQRFGSARAGGFAARHLIRGEFEQALRLAIATPYRRDPPREKRLKQWVAKQWGDWSALAAKLPSQPLARPVQHLARHEGDFAGAFAALPYIFQKMCIEAYQSLLWNRTATQLLRQLLPAAQLLTVPERYGDWVFPETPIPDDLSNLRIPLLTAETDLAGPFADAFRTTLAREGISLDQLQLPGGRLHFTSGGRSLFVLAREFHLSQAQPDKSSGGAAYSREVSFSLPRGAYATVVLRALGQ